jgi:hypothetical protein
MGREIVDCIAAFVLAGLSIYVLITGVMSIGGNVRAYGFFVSLCQLKLVELSSVHKNWPSGEPCKVV